jgi:hypothetical protein
MLEFKSKEKPIKIQNRGTVYFVSWFENFESVKNTPVIIDGKICFVIDVDRNRCSTFYFGRTEDWEHRDVGLLVKD